MALAANERCVPPLSVDEVRGQVEGAVRWVEKQAGEEAVATKAAATFLDEVLAGKAEINIALARGDAADGLDDVGRARTRKPRTALYLPFVDVRLTGPPRWLWRGKVPEGAVTLLAGRPKLGKSVFAVWLAAQLSRGLLPGDYAGRPARSLLIAAEDPVDTIVKSRLIAAAADESMVGTLASRPSRPSHRPGED